MRVLCLQLLIVIIIVIIIFIEVDILYNIYYYIKHRNYTTTTNIKHSMKKKLKKSYLHIINMNIINHLNYNTC